MFCFSTSAAPIADLLLSRAPLGKIASGIHDVRRLTNSTTAAVLANLVRRLREPPEIKWGYDFTFVREPGVRPDDTVHPWLSAAADTLPGKKRHIRLLAKAQSYGEGLARQRNHPLVLPLLSTPIVEACLRIPTWEWINGGRDRAVARRAFSHMLPLEIRDRRSKAGLSSLFSRIFVKNRSHIREVLLDGRLAGAGLLDRVEIDVATRTDIPPTGLHHYRVIELLEAEYWVQRLQL
ncbi:hypothetical protein BHE75_03651 [Sphingomonas haloaromaticamans]|uniref:Asparagine synthetase domain-containing protein n=1 Tax=Edaphosphingomonas haloaromaticamans TaxID=653954 RepID=A0A1S1HMC4_9SPHN|nr:hypothetical protein BHE75_03651 [Sphingomonas haloaromaticamans]